MKSRSLSLILLLGSLSLTSCGEKTYSFIYSSYTDMFNNIRQIQKDPEGPKYCFEDSFYPIFSGPHSNVSYEMKVKTKIKVGDECLSFYPCYNKEYFEPTDIITHYYWNFEEIPFFDIHTEMNAVRKDENSEALKMNAKFVKIKKRHYKLMTADGERYLNNTVEFFMDYENMERDLENLARGIFVIVPF